VIAPEARSPIFDILSVPSRAKWAIIPLRLLGQQNFDILIVRMELSKS
jgi:hypothetical protein